MKVYLDMDGLLANLFDAVALKYTKDNPKGPKHYKQLTDPEKKIAKKIWYDRDHFVENFGDVKEFFANLPTFGDLTKAIVDTVVKEAGGYSICSCPAGIDREASEAGKRIWIHKHLNPLPDEMFFIANKTIKAVNKETGKPNVLIDDYPPYIKAWKAAGGIPIQMRTDKFHSVEDVRAFLTKELNKAKEEIQKPNEPVVKESFDNLYEKFSLKFSL
jgi:hypothetical protein